MVRAIRKIPISQIILDEKIYPRSGISPKRVSMFAENMRDGFKIDPIEVEVAGRTSDYKLIYQLLHVIKLTCQANLCGTLRGKFPNLKVKYRKLKATYNLTYVPESRMV